VLKLTKRDRETFINALLNLPEPNKKPLQPGPE